jgi:hypothetical protein
MTDSPRNDPLESYFDELRRYPFDGVPAVAPAGEATPAGSLPGLLRHIAERLGLVR